MPDHIDPGFEHDVLEADIKRLSAEIRGYRDRPEARGLGGRALVKRSLESMAGAVPAPPPKSAEEEKASPLPRYAGGAPAEVRLEIERLLDLAFHKGILHADTEARKSDAFMVDAFHDALAGKLYPELRKRGVID